MVTDEGLGLTTGLSADDQDRQIDALIADADTGTDPNVGGQRNSALAPGPTARRRLEVIDEEPDLTTSPHGLAEPDEENAAGVNVEPSLVDQEILTNPLAAVGSPDDSADPVADGDEAYVPPMDPVVTTTRPGEVEVLGGFSPSAPEEITPRRSASDGQIGDEAIVDAVQSALRHDAATMDLQIDVTVEQGIVRLRGTVPGMEDIDNVEAVAGRVDGVVDVVEELQVASV